MRARHFTIACKQQLDVEFAEKWAWIRHDRCNVDPHYHYFISFKNPRELKTIATVLGIAPNFIEKVKNKKGIINYLTHSKNPEKTQYSANEIKSNFNLEIEKERKQISFFEVVQLAQTLDLLAFCDKIQKDYEVQSNLASLNCLLNIWRNSRKL